MRRGKLLALLLAGTLVLSNIVVVSANDLASEGQVMSGQTTPEEENSGQDMSEIPRIETPKEEQKITGEVGLLSPEDLKDISEDIKVPGKLESVNGDLQEKPPLIWNSLPYQTVIFRIYHLWSSFQNLNI